MLRFLLLRRVRQIKLLDMTLTFPQSLQWEDLFLFVWLGLAEPLLDKLFGSLLGNVQPWDVTTEHNPILGIIFLLAALGGLIVVGTRAPGQRDLEQGTSSVSSFAHLPMIVTLSYALLYGLGSFNSSLLDAMPCALFAFFIVVGMLFSHLPVLPIVYRRVLITPLILLGTWNFSALIRTFFQGFDLHTILNTPALRDPNSSFTFVLGLLFASLVLFYLIFILAPRQIAYPGGSWRPWIIRFAIYLLGILLNLTWLPVQ